jgi:uncharacterized damage-inducible protein DinB
MDNPKLSVLIELLKQARTQTLKAVEGVPETHRFKQLQAEKATPLWLLGHLSRTVDRIIIGWTLEQPSILGDDLAHRFAPSQVNGMPPTTNPEDYPTWDELTTLYNQVMDQAISGLAKLTDTDLDKPLPGDLPPSYRERFSSIGSALQLLINHDAYHRGQMGLLGKLA